jgi:hypothetical protein
LLGAATVAVTIGILVAGCTDDEQDRVVNASCELSGYAASAIVAAVTTHESAEQIAGKEIAGVLVPSACKALVTSLIDAPEKTVEPIVTLPSGQTISQTMSGSQFLAPPPQSKSLEDVPPGTTVSELINCGGWDAKFLWKLCLQGQLPAKRTAYADQLLGR